MMSLPFEFSPPTALLTSYPTRRRRRRTTSPPLVNIEPNPGPRTKASRKVAKNKSPRAIKRKYLSSFQKGEIFMGLKHGISTGAIAADVGCHPDTARRYKVKLAKGLSFDTKPKPGRPSKLTLRQHRWLIRQSITNRRLSSKVLAQNLFDEYKISYSSRRIREKLCSAGLFGRLAARKPQLRVYNVHNRLHWAKERLNWSPEMWCRVIWTDESPFTLYPTSGRVMVRRREGERYEPECLLETVKHGGKKSWYGGL
jgi:transposase